MPPKTRNPYADLFPAFQTINDQLDELLGNVLKIDTMDAGPPTDGEVEPDDDSETYTAVSTAHTAFLRAMQAAGVPR